MIVIGVDPGVKSIGFGVASNDQIVAGGLIRCDNPTPQRLATMLRDRLYALGVYEANVVIEVPQIYSAGRHKGDQNDLINVALVSGAVAGVLDSRGALCSSRFVLPREWKGGVEADVFTARIEKRLVPSELAALDKAPASLRHNMIDGVGLALFGSGKRLEPRRNYHD